MAYSILKMIILSIVDLFKFFIFGEYDKSVTKSYGHPDFDVLRLIKNMTLVVLSLTVIVLYKIDIELLRANEEHRIKLMNDCTLREYDINDENESINLFPVGSK